MGCAWRRARHKRYYGQRIDTTFTPPPPQTFLRATSSILTYKVHRAKRWNNGNRVPITMSDFTKEQYTEVTQMLDFDATPQEGMIFHSAGQASGGWRVLGI